MLAASGWGQRGFAPAQSQPYPSLTWSPRTDPSALEVWEGELGRPKQCCQSRCTLTKNHSVVAIQIPFAVIVLIDLLTTVVAGHFPTYKDSDFLPFCSIGNKANLCDVIYSNERLPTSALSKETGEPLCKFRPVQSRRH